MANFWQPRIDKWLENVNINNTPAFSTSYQYAPSEGEEGGKVFVTGHGHLTLSQLKSKISDIINSIASLSTSDDLKSIEQIQHALYTSPDLSNLLKQYIESVRSLRSGRSE